MGDDDSALFYPTPDMFAADGLINFDHNFNFNAMPTAVPIVTPNNFDLYNSNVYNGMQRNFPSSYEHYHQISKSNQQYPSTKPNASHSLPSVASANNDVVFAQHCRTEYPGKMNTVPNLGLNIRAPTPPIVSNPEPIELPETTGSILNQVEDMPMDNPETNGVSSSMPNEELNLSLDPEHFSMN